MYAAYYGFSEDPFQLTPDPTFLYLDEVYREALAHIEYGVNTGKGFVLLTGEVGTGKTTLVHSFLERHAGELVIAFVFSTAMNFIELLRLVHEDFDTKAEGDSEAFLLIELNRFLLKQYHEGRRTVLILDEAQNLSDDLLEKIRMLSNLESRKSKLLQTILVGQPELAAKLEQPKLRQLKQRLAVRFDIPPMTEERTWRYVKHRLEVASAPDTDLFTDEAMRALAAESAGIPRLVNVLCSNALLLGFALGRSRIDGPMIDEVIADLRRGVPSKSASPAASGDASLHAAIGPSRETAIVPAFPDERPLTAAEAGSYLRVSTRTARRLLRAGAIPASKVGRGWRVLRGDLDAYVRGGGPHEKRPGQAGGGGAARGARGVAGAVRRGWTEARQAYGAPEDRP